MAGWRAMPCARTNWRARRRWRATSSPRPNGLHCCREHVRTAAAPTGPLLRARFALLGSRDRPGEPRMSGHSQFQLLRQRRFLPFFATQCFGAFNDNVYRQAIIGMLFWLGVSAEQKKLYATLAPANSLLPYFLFSALAAQFAERPEQAALIPLPTAIATATLELA